MAQYAPSNRQPVLVIEDEPILRMAALDMVEEAGFDPIGATDATDAIRILESRHDIRIVFTDVDMPRGVDGLKLAAFIRERWPPIHIIVTSGKMEVGRMKLPVDCVFFGKPYDERRVIAEMHRMSRIQ
ncbi:chemotaxis protein CheY [Paracoccus sp. S4493]|uniref:response regulator n=1 Tax=Paracoccus sp. S4493 TaxID=579490 RepID=UPI0005FA8B1F|nr:response regulator [Paracoccus sp. S4493]KJZ30347.1 chemotaxis protein CheY [Paracoccus sp. S4493]